MIPVNQACEKILGAVPEGTSERLPLLNCCGKILRQEVLAERDAPPFDRVMMDGFAIAYGDVDAGQYTICGTALAGHAPPSLADKSHCIEVTTGCPLPDGCDTVVPVEDCLVDGEQMILIEGCEVSPGQYIHRMGSDRKGGSVVLRTGSRIGAPEMAVLATENINEVTVSHMPRIGLLTTGDEVVHDGSALEPEQIRGSHYPALFGLLIQFPGIHLVHQHANDDEDELMRKLSTCLEQSDILLITGGVSRGKKDLVPGLLQRLGVEEILHRVAQRPGKPLWFGTKAGKLVFGLPGNPISSLVCSRRYVFPVIEKWMGGKPTDPVHLKTVNPVEPIEGMTRYVPVRITAEGAVTEPFATSGSLHALAGTDGFIEVPPGKTAEGPFDFYSWNTR